MKKTTKLKALLLSAAMLATMLPITMDAQNRDGFFRGGDETYENRDYTDYSGDGIHVQTFGQDAVPLGSGLLVMVAAGAGYAVARRRKNVTRRNNNKSVVILLAFAMILTFTQCKKKDIAQTASENSVRITLKVDDASKIWVTPSTGEVSFTSSDILYVGNNNKYCGYLEYDEKGKCFWGDITPTSTDDYLYFYLLGGNIYLPKPSAEITSYTISISDQNSRLPVLSFGKSNEKYSSSVSDYTCLLLNKCALVKIGLAVETTSNGTLSMMINEATIDFADHDNPIVPSGKGGSINLYSETNTAKWAIVMPNAKSVSTTFTIDGEGFAVTIPAVEANGYVNSGITVDNHGHVTDNKFSVGASSKVYIAPGNLQYKASDGTWRFAENQYDRILEGNTNISDTYDGWIDLFGWGTWTKGKNPATSSNITEDYTWSEDDFSGTVSNNPNTGWRTLTQAEWDYLLNTRSTTSGIRYAKAIVNGVKGVVVLPDDWLSSIYYLGNTNYPGSSYYNTITLSNWTDKLEANGAIFLPCGGFRSGTTIYEYSNEVGNYWSSSPYNEEGYARYFGFTGAVLDPSTSSYNPKYGGYSVRLVRDVPSEK